MSICELSNGHNAVPIGQTAAFGGTKQSLMIFLFPQRKRRRSAANQMRDAVSATCFTVTASQSSTANYPRPRSGTMSHPCHTSRPLVTAATVRCRRSQLPRWYNEDA